MYEKINLIDLQMYRKINIIELQRAECEFFEQRKKFGFLIG